MVYLKVFLSEPRGCSPQFLQDEINFLINVFVENGHDRSKLQKSLLTIPKLALLRGKKNCPKTASKSHGFQNLVRNCEAFTVRMGSMSSSHRRQVWVTFCVTTSVHCLLTVDQECTILIANVARRNMLERQRKWWRPELSSMNVMSSMVDGRNLDWLSMQRIAMKFLILKARRHWLQRAITESERYERL